MTTQTNIVNEPVLPEVKMHLHRPKNPGVGVVVSNERCTLRKPASFIRHVCIDVSKTEIAGNFRAGQSFGVIPPGTDANGKPHKVRLYSIASPTRGEDGQGNVLATGCKRVIDEHWDTHKLMLGVCSNYLCDLQVGDEVRVTGPAGKRFLVPDDPSKHDYLFFGTGTGIVPFRGMTIDLLEAGCTSQIVLFMGSPFTQDLLYHEQFLELAEKHDNFHYITAISRERQEDGHGRLYVQDRLRTHADLTGPLLESDRGLVYICGLTGMEIGIIKQMAGILSPEALAQYVRVDPEAAGAVDSWDRSMLNKQLKVTRRMAMEVY